MWFGYILGTLTFEPYGTDTKAYQMIRKTQRNTKQYRTSMF